MASRRFDEIGTLGVNRVAVGGSFFTGSLQTTGLGFSVSEISTGHYRVQFNNNFFGFDRGFATVRRPTGIPSYATFGPFDSVNNTIDIFTFSSENGIDRKVTIPLYPQEARILDSVGDFKNLANHGGVLASDSTDCYIVTTNGLDTRVMFPAGSTQSLLWSVFMPDDIPNSSQCSFRMVAKTAGITDRDGFSVGIHYNDSATNWGGNVGPFSGNEFLPYALFFTSPASDTTAIHITLTPKTHNTDLLEMVGAELIYTRNVPGAFQPESFAQDPNSLISFNCVFINSGCGY
jgi:hypothetical protein